MDFTRIQQLWTEHSDPMPGDDQARIRQVTERARRLNRRVRARDYVELLTALGMSALFGWIATRAPVVWPWAAAAVITLGVGAVFARERFRQEPPDGRSTDVRLGLERAIADVDHQVRLLGSVASWYLAPLGVVVVLISAGALLGAREEVDPDVWARSAAGLVGAFAVVLVAVGGVFWLVWRLNQRAVTKELLPLRRQLTDMMAQLEDGETDKGEEA